MRHPADKTREELNALRDNYLARFKNGGVAPPSYPVIENHCDEEEGYFIYFIVSEEHPKLKIGITVDISQRLTQLRAMSPCKLYLFGFVKVRGSRSDTLTIEESLHEYFRRHRTHGEWFDLDPTIENAVRHYILHERLPLRPQLDSQLPIRQLQSKK